MLFWNSVSAIWVMSCAGLAAAQPDIAGIDLIRSKADGARETAITTVRAPEPVREGDTALKFEIKPGDCHGSDCENDRERVELKSRGTESAGTRVNYSWSFYLPADFQPLWPAREFIAQFHQDGGKPVLLLSLEPEGLRFESRYRDGEKPLLIPAAELYGRWHDISIDIVWSKQAGEVLVAIDGVPRLVSHQQTMSEDQAYFKIGLYRAHLSRNRDAAASTQIMFADRIVRTLRP